MNNLHQMADFGKELMALTDIDKTLEIVALKAKNLINSDRCSVFIVDNEDKMLWTKLTGSGRIVISLDSGIVGDTYIKQAAQIVNNPYEDARFLPSIDKQSGYETKNILTVPIFDSKRDVIGVIELLNKSRFDFDEKDLDTLTFFANYVSGSLELVLMRTK